MGEGPGAHFFSVGTASRVPTENGESVREMTRAGGPDCGTCEHHGLSDTVTTCCRTQELVSTAAR